MPGENENELREFGARLRESLKPVGDTEEMLAERIESCAWRLKRIKRVEAGLFAHGFFEKASATQGTANRTSNQLNGCTCTSPKRTDNELKYKKATAEHHEIITAQQTTTGAEATDFLQDAQTNNAFSKLSGYEAGLERSFTRRSTNSKNYNAFGATKKT
jgi:hypothetical protein